MGSQRQGMKVKAYAKINLSLDVLGKLETGYHEVCMVMQEIDLYDTISLNCEPAEELEIEGSTNRNDLAMGRSNIAYKAALLMQSTYRPQENFRIRIEIEKRIPVAAGLGGGSADGAAVMRALAHLWELKVSPEELARLSENLGADVPFCLLAQEGQSCALARGIGELLSPLPSLPAWVLLSKPPVGVSTQEVYGALRLEEVHEHPNTEELICGLQEGNLAKVGRNMKNLLETVTLEKYPVVAETKAAMEKLGAYCVLMSGSGPTVYGIYTNKERAKMAFREMKKRNQETYLVRTIK